MFAFLSNHDTLVEVRRNPGKMSLKVIGKKKNTIADRQYIPEAINKLVDFLLRSGEKNIIPLKTHI